MLKRGRSESFRRRNLPSIERVSFGRFHLPLWPGIQHYPIRLLLALAECLGNAGKVVPMFGSVRLTMSAYLLNDGIFNHPSLSPSYVSRRSSETSDSNRLILSTASVSERPVPSSSTQTLNFSVLPMAALVISGI